MIEEIIAHFRQELGQELELFEGGIERENLNFEVQQTEPVAKFSRVHDLLDERLGEEGCAVVYVATRKTAEKLAEYLVRQGWQAAAFHAGLSPPDKRRIQDEFVGGELRVICATNAFGMGIDKDDVRMVVHADMPGSLENYLQEAGRAGRDRQPAQCVLLYDQQDVETQFALNAISQLTPRDIRQILRGLRRAKRKSECWSSRPASCCATRRSRRRSTATTTWRTPRSRRRSPGWNGPSFLERNQNATYVFSGKPQVRSLEEAEQKIDRLGLPPEQRRQWLEILQRLINTEGPEGISADSLAELPAFYATRGACNRRPNAIRPARRSACCGRWTRCREPD